MMEKFKFCNINWSIFLTVVKQDVASSKSVIGNLNTAVTSRFFIPYPNEIFFSLLKFEKKLLPASTAGPLKNILKHIFFKFQPLLKICLMPFPLLQLLKMI